MVGERRRSRGLKCHLSCVGSSLLVYINKTCDDITDLVESSPALPRYESPAYLVYLNVLLEQDVLYC